MKQVALSTLAPKIKGELLTDDLHRRLYATDASIYRELPLGVAYPKDEEDVINLVRFAYENNISIIPRTAGTSLAGQCVGNGLVVDVSRHMNAIIHVESGKAIVQPGVIRDEINRHAKAHGSFFSPITSTANRAMIGGMVGNNSSGTTSIRYKTTREQITRIRAVLSDGSLVEFGKLTAEEFGLKCDLPTLEGNIYRGIADILQRKDVQVSIDKDLPKPEIHRRNTGYAIDELINMSPFNEEKTSFNMCALICGSEGTLCIATEIELHLDELPPTIDVVLAPHFTSIIESLKATQVIMKHSPYACELMDKIILDCTKSNIEQSKNRWFVEGDPKAILMIECRGTSIQEAMTQAQLIKEDLIALGMGYAHPIIGSDKASQVWQLRSAGLGLLSNIPSKKKAIACIEDTAVTLEDLPAYIEEFQSLMTAYGQDEVVYYAHAGAGEIHLRPILDLRETSDIKLFEEITADVAKLVKKYRGSLSGEHGDGRVRSPYIPLMVGPTLYSVFEEIKRLWDIKGILNPGKIVNAKPISDDLRALPGSNDEAIDTMIRFEGLGGIVGMAEQCNGSGDCRKLSFSGGTMCPSYHVTRQEKDTTRARANILREYLTRNENLSNKFNQKEIKEVLDLCISCKGCTSECPSNVDMSTMKAEFLHQYQKSNGISLRSRAFTHIDKLNKVSQLFYPITKLVFKSKILMQPIKKILRIASKRELPLVSKSSLQVWYKSSFKSTNHNAIRGELYIFADEFTNRLDVNIGQAAIKLLDKLGYRVSIIEHPESGRAAISKGVLSVAKSYANQQVSLWSSLISDKKPLVGIEPSAILTFRDEYPKLVDQELLFPARELAKHVFTIEEFISREIDAGRITSDFFSDKPLHILLHGHCHQKALSDISHSNKLLSLPERHTVETIPSGCCGMAGSFGYEEEHYEVSMKIGELILFPKVRDATPSTTISASGNSCRHQIYDGTGKSALHPVEILFNALRD